MYCDDKVSNKRNQFGLAMQARNKKGRLSHVLRDGAAAAGNTQQHPVLGGL